ncbi:hypothetical protein [Massilia scottii]|uniref:hypothetical protein n=1 Tax=Massilia scottii TaxID=3057166 RepID=UPI0035B693BE
MRSTHSKACKPPPREEPTMNTAVWSSAFGSTGSVTGPKGWLENTSSTEWIASFRPRR